MIVRRLSNVCDLLEGARSTLKAAGLVGIVSAVLKSIATVALVNALFVVALELVRRTSFGVYKNLCASVLLDRKFGRSYVRRTAISPPTLNRK